MAALLVATTGLAMTSTSADAAARKKASVTVAKVAGVPKITVPAGAFNVTTTVRNAGRKPAKATLVFRLSKDKRLDGKDKQLRSVKTGKLRPGATKVRTAVKLPKAVAERSYYLFACVGSSCKAARTSVHRSDAPPPSKGDQGKLTGTLAFERKALDGWTGVDDTATINVAMNYKGPFAVSNDLVNTGSTATYDHTHTKVAVDGAGCTTTTTDTTKATSRPLRTTGDLYNDEITGAVAINDFSEIHVDLNVEYLYTTEVVKGGPAGCAPSRTESTHKSWDLMVIRLTKASRSGSDITYRFKSAEGSMGSSVPWNITSTLKLHLG